MYSEMGERGLLCCFAVLVRKLWSKSAFGDSIHQPFAEQWGAACLSSGGCNDVFPVENV